MRRAHARDHVLALRVDQIFAVENFLAGRGIAREGHAGCAGFAHVAKHHRLDIHRGSPVVWDAVFPSIHDRAIVHPRTKHGADCAPELFVRILGKRFAGALLDQRLETLHELFQIGDR